MTKSILPPHCARTLVFQSGDWPSGYWPGAHQHRADLDRRVLGLHGVDVLHDVLAVGGRRMVAVQVGLEGPAVLAVAVDLVADLPVLDAVLLGVVGVVHPGGGLAGVAPGVAGGVGAVVDAVMSACAPVWVTTPMKASKVSFGLMYWPWLAVLVCQW